MNGAVGVQLKNPIGAQVVFLRDGDAVLVDARIPAVEGVDGRRVRAVARPWCSKV